MRVEFFFGLTFSHDGNYIYFVNQEMNHVGKLFQVPSLGGTPTQLIEDIDSPVTLSPDDQSLAFVRGSRDYGASSSRMPMGAESGNWFLRVKATPCELAHLDGAAGMVT